MHSLPEGHILTRFLTSTAGLVFVLPGLALANVSTLLGQDVPVFQQVDDAAGLHFRHLSPFTPERHLHGACGQ